MAAVGGGLAAAGKHPAGGGGLAAGSWWAGWGSPGWVAVDSQLRPPSPRSRSQAVLVGPSHL